MTEDLDDLRDRYLRLQLAGDRRAALELVEVALRQGKTVEHLRGRVVQEAQREIGRLWQEDRITVAQEHMATAISQLVLSHLFQHADFRERIPKKILVSCVPGEHHEFPARLLADTLDVAGYHVRFLGADVPLDSLIRAVEAETPDVVALSVTMLFHLSAARNAVRALRTRIPHPPQIAVGGNVFANAPELASEIEADMVASQADDFVAQLGRRFGAAA